MAVSMALIMSELCRPHLPKKILMGRAGTKGSRARGNFHWRAPMSYFMTSSFVKFMFSLIHTVLVCFFQ